MPIEPNFLERQLLFRFNKGPAPMLDLLSVVAFYAVAAAVKLDLFETLEQRPYSLEGLTAKLEIDEKGAIVLLEVLESLGYVSRNRNNGRDGFANTPMTSSWMVSSAAVNFAHGFEFFEILASRFLPELGSSIQEGRGPMNLYDWLADRPGDSDIFQAWLATTSRMVGEEIASRLDLPDVPLQILDVGGGHGGYSIALCQRYPQASATILDSKEPLKSAADFISADGLNDRISLREGDFLADDLGTGYDLVLLFNIIHGLDAAQIKSLFERIKIALNRGGQVAILESLAGGEGTKLTAVGTRLFGLLYFLNLGGQIYRFEDVRSLLLNNGFSSPRRINLRRVNGATLILSSPNH